MHDVDALYNYFENVISVGANVANTDNYLIPSSYKEG